MIPRLRHVNGNSWESRSTGISWLSHVPPDLFGPFCALVADCLCPSGRAFPIEDRRNPTRTTPDPYVLQEADDVQTRRLSDGSEHRVITVFMAGTFEVRLRISRAVIVGTSNDRRYSKHVAPLCDTAASHRLLRQASRRALGPTAEPGPSSEPLSPRRGRRHDFRHSYTDGKKYCCTCGSTTRDGIKARSMTVASKAHVNPRGYPH